MILPELIELSETDKFVENLLDRAVKNVFGNRKPLTEISDNIDKDSHNNLPNNVESLAIKLEEIHNDLNKTKL